MKTLKRGLRLSRYVYTMEDQSRFSQLSGDRNPIHLDPVAARRTLAGAPIVHGVHIALSALEQVLQRAKPESVTSLSANFVKPLFLDEPFEFRVTDSSQERLVVAAQIKSETVSEIVMTFGSGSAPEQREMPTLQDEPMAVLDFNEVAVQKGSLAVGLDGALAHELFPETLKLLGTGALAEILALTRLVGMRCPGLHSLFNRFAIRFDSKEKPGVLRYHVEKSDERFKSVEIAVSGNELTGLLSVFVRPTPENQPAMEEMVRLVEPGCFSSSRALIVGGSRGLGEITAKLIAAGGGLPIITYYKGQTDAEKIVDEIRRWGGRCEAVHLDVARANPTLQALVKSGYSPRSVYYFATPKVFGNRRGFFSHELAGDFMKCYVTAFGRFIDQLPTPAEGKLRVLYPSTTAIDEGVRSMAEYAIAKRAGEELCAFYNRFSKKIEIIVERLPRIRTDQTQSLLSVASHEGTDVLLPIVRKVES